MASTTDLINATYEELNSQYTKKDIKEITTAYKDAILKLLKSGEDASIYGLVNFRVVDVAERRGTNTLTEDGKEWVVPAHKEVKAKISKAAKFVD